jgi:hypothetical protein
MTVIENLQIETSKGWLKFDYTNESMKPFIEALNYFCANACKSESFILDNGVLFNFGKVRMVACSTYSFIYYVDITEGNRTFKFQWEN